MGEGDELVGRIVAAKYAVQSVIGQGAMGVVYRAKQIKLEKIVALKVLPNALRNDAEFVQRFHIEARAASRLDHPHSTHVLDFGEDADGMLYIAMELLEGRTLAELVAREFPLPPARIASILSQTLSAVGAAHQLKILHRDLKPENIVILEGRDDEDRPIDIVKVCDFGIAKVDTASDADEKSPSVYPPPHSLTPPTWGKSRNATRAGVIVGTPQYMSPEQARAAKLDMRSDLYSLGVVMYEMLTSRAPFDEGTPAEVLAKHVAVDPPPPSAQWSNVSPELEAICMRALKKNPDDRGSSAREMRAALRPLLDAQLQEPSVPFVARSDGRAAATMGEGERFAGAPTISATAVALEPKKKRSRATWVVPVALACAAATAFFVVHRAKTTSARAPMSNAALTVAPEIPGSFASSPLVLTQRVDSPNPVAPIPTTHHIAHAIHTQTIAPDPTAQAIETTSAIAMDTAPPPPPPATIAPPPPTVLATVTPAPPVVHADPARVHVDIGSIRADRVSMTSVESVMRHVDFTGCYRAEVAQQHEQDGDGTLNIDLDEERVVRADLSGGMFTPSLRQCVARRALGARVQDADTGGATAKITLRFVLR